MKSEPTHRLGKLQLFTTGGLEETIEQKICENPSLKNNSRDLTEYRLRLH